MASTIIKIARKLRRIPENTALVSLRRSLCTEIDSNCNNNSFTGTRTAIRGRENLYARINPLGNPSISIVPVLDQWVQEGKQIDRQDFRNIIKSLRSRRRYSHAFQASEWLSNKGLCPFSSSDCALHLDLIGKVHGVECAESYFNSLSGLEEMGKLYGALLNCYVRESLEDKSLSLMQKMKDLGFSNTLSYNNIMNLYKNTDQLDKIPSVLLEMKKDGCEPNNYSYRLCITAFGTRSDIENMEIILKEMESQPEFLPEWGTYALVANFYIKAGDQEKSLIYLKKCEKLVGKEALGYNHLISHHANLGHKDEMKRLWALQKANCKKHINRDYVTMLGLLVRLGEFEEAEKLLKEWESSCRFCDFRVPNILLIGYCQKGMVEKAEATLSEMISKGKTPIPNSWAIIAAGYLDGQNLEKAFECMKKALALQAENIGWRPKNRVLLAILNWLVDSRDVEELEDYVSSMKNVFPVNREVYNALIRAYIRAGKEVDGILEQMKSDDIDVDEETKKILKAQAQ